jgi:hypothetical protein
LAKRRIAVRKKSSKRSKATAKPTPKKAKRTTAKNAMSKIRRVDTRAVSDAHAKLEALSLAERIAAVAADVPVANDSERIYVVDGSGRGHNALDGARQIANESPVFMSSSRAEKIPDRHPLANRRLSQSSVENAAILSRSRGTSNQ